MNLKSTVSWGFGSIYGYVLAFLSALVATVGSIADDVAPLGIEPKTLGIISAGLVIVTQLGRYAQSAWGSKPVGWGPASLITFAVSVVSGLLLVLGDLSDEAFLLGMTENTWAAIIAVLGVFLVFGRQLLAVFGETGNEGDLPDVPPAPEPTPDVLEPHV
jgi:hypothetical protein